MQFRADINGLRAIAVLSILVFHVNPARLPGGFVGVDIFYVISGYLITSIIWRDISNNKFSLSAFYARRARRLFPALLVMLIAVYVAGLWFLLPFEAEDLGQSMISSALYVSNFFFYTKSGYFDTASELSPLIHTWSLAIEEQFYLLLPAGLLFLVRLKKPVAAYILLAAVISFLACLAAMQTDTAAAFYFSPFRFWELLLGSLVAFWKPVLKLATRESAALTGLALIAASILLFNENLPFPGPMALLPAAGAALVILSGMHQKAIVVRWLALSPVQWFGRISYSLYLWHWPVIVFYKVAINSRPDLKEQVLLLALSVGLGALSYYAVEAPSMKYLTRWSSRRLILGAAAVSAVVIAASIPLVVTGGFSSRFNPQVSEIGQYLAYDPNESQRVGQCFITSKNTVADFDAAKCLSTSASMRNFLLMGDSHAAHYYPGLRDELTDINIVQVTASGCKPIYKPTGEQRCTDLISSAYDRFIPDGHFDKIIISGLWEAADVPQVKASVERLQSNGQHVVVLGPIVTYVTALPRLLAMSIASGRADIVTEAQNYKAVAAVDAAMSSAIAETGATYISILDLICPDMNCTTEIGDVPIQFDYGHLTQAGADYLVEQMKSVLLQ